MVEAEQESAGAKARSLAVAGGGPRFDDDFDVVDAVQQFRRDERDRFPNESPKLRAFQRLSPRGRGAPKRPEAHAPDRVSLQRAFEGDEFSEGILGEAHGFHVAAIADAAHDFVPDAAAGQGGCELWPPH